MSLNNYDAEIASAVRFFWEKRDSQSEKQKASWKQDAWSRGAVTWWKQMDWFLNLFVQVAMDCWVPIDCVHTKKNTLPWFFRATKNWDLVVLSPKGKLIACLELKSHVGSFWNNFNNRTEEALGNSIDIWTAFREGSFPDQNVPHVGFVMVAEDSMGSSKTVKVVSKHFPARPEFANTSYLDRYKLLCQKMVRERCYSAAWLIYTSKDKTYRHPEGAAEISIASYLNVFQAHISQQLNAESDLSE